MIFPKNEKYDYFPFYSIFTIIFYNNRYLYCTFLLFFTITGVGYFTFFDILIYGLQRKSHVVLRHL